MFGYTLTAKQYASLSGTQWLYGEAIDAFINVHCRQQRTDGPMPWKRVLSSSFYEMRDNHEYTAKQTINWDTTDIRRTIIIPINTHSHWFLVVLNAAHGRFDVLDSYRKQHEEVVHSITEWFNEEHRRITGSEFRREQWDVAWGARLPRDFPKQTDSTSCGVLTAMAAWYLLVHDRLPTTHDYTQADVPELRMYMANILRIAYTTERDAGDVNNFFDNDMDENQRQWDVYKDSVMRQRPIPADADVMDVCS
jgi:Ulp1 family protease